MKRKVFRTANSIGHIEYRDDEPEITVMIQPDEKEVQPLYPTGIEVNKESEDEGEIEPLLPNLE